LVCSRGDEAHPHPSQTTITLIDLWLPILLSAVIVFVASSIIWTATPLHRGDYTHLGESELAILDAIRSSGLAPGVYFLP